MAKSKCCVRVQNSLGEISFTSVRGAKRMEGRGLARRLSNGTLQMIESDYRYQSQSGTPQGPQLAIAIRKPWEPCWLNSEAAVIRFDGRAA